MITRLRAAVLVLASLLVASCVVISGQRISWFHDQEKDSLKILIHYDGIHEGTTDSRKGSDQVPKFIKDGDILLIDWWGHLKIGQLREKLRTGNMIEKIMAATLTAFHSEVVGHYHDPGGRIGALQVVTIPKVSRFLRKLNSLINTAVLAGQIRSKHPRIQKRFTEAARDRHTWVALQGQSIRVMLPCEPAAAHKLKERLLQSLVHRIFSTDDYEEHKKLVARIAQQVARAPLSFIQEEEQLTIVLGYKTATSTLRLTTRDEYNDQLEPVVAKEVSIDLDKQLAAALIQRHRAAKASSKPTALPGLFGELERFGPKENLAGALLRVSAAAESGFRLPKMTPDLTRQLAHAVLTRLGETWRAAGDDTVPKPNDDPAALQEAWEGWYIRTIGRIPLGDDDK